MIHRIFTVYDNAVEAYLRPFFAMTSGEAERIFRDTINDSASPFSRHPADYSLFEIGTYDDVSATIVPDSPRSLGNALTFVNKDPNDAS